MSKRKRRPKRIFPRKFTSDYINVTRGWDVNKTIVYDCFSKRATIKTKETNPLFETEEFEICGKKYIERRTIAKGKNGAQITYLGEVPDTVGIVGKKQDTASVPRSAAMKRHHEVWQSDKHQGFDTFEHFILLYDYNNIKLKLFISGARYLIVKEFATVHLRSYVYSTKQDALTAIHDETITWKDTIYV